MPVFSVSGGRPTDLWLVDGSPNFGFFPAGIIGDVDVDLPIWLKVGTVAYGVRHIEARHAIWIEKLQKKVPELVYEKLRQPGGIYSTETNSKLKVSLRVNPSSILVLQLIHDGMKESHFSVTSLYAHPKSLDGTWLGRYEPR